jgi:multisubunit Na+/H+ antiporter MnhG subunit
MVLIVLFAVLLFVAIIGLVYMEKSFFANTIHSKSEVFSVVFKMMGDHIQRTGPNVFLLQVIGFVIGSLVLSVTISLVVVHNKDLGGAL